MNTSQLILIVLAAVVAFLVFPSLRDAFAPKPSAAPPKPTEAEFTVQEPEDPIAVLSARMRTQADYLTTKQWHDQAIVSRALADTGTIASGYAELAPTPATPPTPKPKTTAKPKAAAKPKATTKATTK